MCCGAGGLTQVHAADPIGITYAAPVATAVFTNGWQHSDLVRTSRHHAAEPSVVVANVVSARCMARQSTGALVGGATCRVAHELAGVVLRRTLMRSHELFADAVHNLAANIL